MLSLSGKALTPGSPLMMMEPSSLCSLRATDALSTVPAAPAVPDLTPYPSPTAPDTLAMAAERSCGQAPVL
eukprot:CAMPEP_0182914948 /NCGR_PEP_ID=MMETSP0034_2-20130328/38832_1 /TAXON_ID=156128 /ORGANISM="Nephroselmis pyriformis, Strain CCMP717" /LENGTH=70 /DNA_ID=CAMNT_0025051739 /DNA_START=751 /DNA_END=959 /DNA_ORIENTATION=+